VNAATVPADNGSRTTRPLPGPFCQPSSGAPSPEGTARGLRCSIARRQALVAIWYSHTRSDERPSNWSTARQARTKAFYTASSASATEASIR
jgi:hypothetical protein